MTSLTPEANRAARAILKWSIRKLATEAGLAPITIFTLERGRIINQTSQLKIVEAFQRHQVEIISKGGSGARIVH